MRQRRGVGEITGREAAVFRHPAMLNDRLQRFDVIARHLLDGRAMVHGRTIIPGQLQPAVNDAGVYFEQMIPRG